MALLGKCTLPSPCDDQQPSDDPAMPARYTNKSVAPSDVVLPRLVEVLRAGYP
jgi:hypothetical protein